MEHIYPSFFKKVYHNDNVSLKNNTTWRFVSLKKMTYAKSGVDILKEEKAIKKMLSSMTYQRKGIGKPMGGHYAGMIEFGDFALVLCTDGVGSKVLIASEMKKWDTVGIDCIAMNVNDAICVGAEPLAFVDYLAIDNPKPEITKEIGKGLSKGAKQANISIIGGETASLPDLINGFDLAGTCLAYVKKDDIIIGDKIKKGDTIIGISSSGIHSNGYTLVRKILEENKINYNDKFPNGYYPNKKIGEILLTPTQIYVREVVELLKNIKIHGISHITGGGLRNILRLNDKVKYVIDNPFKPQQIFEFIKQNGKISDQEMYQTFNMGMGLAVIVSEEKADETIDILRKKSRVAVKKVGRVEKGKGLELKKPHLRF